MELQQQHAAVLIITEEIRTLDHNFKELEI